MGRSYTFRYSVELTTLTGYNTPAGWPTTNRVGDHRPKELLGRPTDAKLARYVADYNASLEPGGANAHIGPSGRATAACIKDGYDIVATWKA